MWNICSQLSKKSDMRPKRKETLLWAWAWFKWSPFPLLPTQSHFTDFNENSWTLLQADLVANQTEFREFFFCSFFCFKTLENSFCQKQLLFAPFWVEVRKAVKTNFEREKNPKKRKNVIANLMWAEEVAQWLMLWSCVETQSVTGHPSWNSLWSVDVSCSLQYLLPPILKMFISKDGALSFSLGISCHAYYNVPTSTAETQVRGWFSHNSFAFCQPLLHYNVGCTSITVSTTALQ